MINNCIQVTWHKIIFKMTIFNLNNTGQKLNKTSISYNYEMTVSQLLWESFPHINIPTSFIATSIV